MKTHPLKLLCFIMLFWLISACSSSTIIPPVTSTKPVVSQGKANTVKSQFPKEQKNVETLIAKAIKHIDTRWDIHPMGHTQPALVKDRGATIANPFKRIPNDVKQRLLKRGVDLNKMAAYRTVYIAGAAFAGTFSHVLINPDPKTIVILASDSVIQKLYSRGPVLLMGQSSAREIHSSNLVWFGNKSAASKVTGFPILGVKEPLPALTYRALRHTKPFPMKIWHDYPLGNPFTVAEEVNAAIRMGKEKGADTPYDKMNKIYASKVGKPIKNPLLNLSASQKQLLLKNRVNINKLKKLKAVLIPKRNTDDIINNDQNLLLVVPKQSGFYSILSMGPVISYSNNISMLHGEQLVWAMFTMYYAPEGMDYRGNPVITKTFKPVAAITDKAHLVWE